MGSEREELQSKTGNSRYEITKLSLKKFTKKLVLKKVQDSYDLIAPFFYNPDKDALYIGVQELVTHRIMAKRLKMNWCKDAWVMGFIQLHKHSKVMTVLSYNVEHYCHYTTWCNNREELSGFYESSLAIFDKYVQRIVGDKIRHHREVDL